MNEILARPGRILVALMSATLVVIVGARADSTGAVAEATMYGPRPAHVRAMAFLLGGFGSPLPAGRGLQGLALAGGAAAVPEPGSSSLLRGMYCTSAANCWAVGSYRSATGAMLNEVLHWNGSVWRRVAVPSPAGTARGDISLLVAVRCLTAANCLAVGAQAPNGGAILSQALHWNGKRWSATAVPDPGGILSGDVNELLDVACAARSSCWATGQYGTLNGGTVLLNQALHWNGKTWALVPTPDPSGTAHGDFNALISVRCPSAADCLAVGTSSTNNSFARLNEAMRWNGKRWSVLSVPSPGGTEADDFSELFGLACTSSETASRLVPSVTPPGRARCSIRSCTGTARVGPGS